VLIVEDDNDIRDALEQILTEEGFDVVTASNGELGLRRLAERAPVLILLDLMMPVMNGWQFRQRQLADPRFAQTPVVIISADSAAPHEAESLTTEGFLQKPIELDVLIGLVERYCVRRAHTDAAHSQH
jgi:DNA-binding response OmpR family regulator